MLSPQLLGLLRAWWRGAASGSIAAGCLAVSRPQSARAALTRQLSFCLRARGARQSTRLRSMRSQMSRHRRPSPAMSRCGSRMIIIESLGCDGEPRAPPPPQAGGRLLFRPRRSSGSTAWKSSATRRAPDTSLSLSITQSTACFASFINQNQERLCIRTAGFINTTEYFNKNTQELFHHRLFVQGGYARI
jgi:hypothetical protein